MAFESLFQKYDRLVLFDTETTGLSFSRDEIIQFSAAVLECRNGAVDIILISDIKIYFAFKVCNCLINRAHILIY